MLIFAEAKKTRRSAYRAAADFTTKAFPQEKYEYNLLQGLGAAGFTCDPALANIYDADLKIRIKPPGPDLHQAKMITEPGIGEVDIDCDKGYDDLVIGKMEDSGHWMAPAIR